jgi:hypothetical protein
MILLLLAVIHRKFSMSGCLCHIPKASYVSAHASAKAFASLSLETGPLLKLEAAAALAESAELDLSDMFGLEKSVSALPPSLTTAVTGQLMQVAMVAKMTGGHFSLFDPIKLKVEMRIASDAINAAAPAISAMAAVNLSAVLKLAAVARVVIRLKLMGLDPEDPGFVDAVHAKANAAASVQYSKPKIAFANMPRIRLLAALPTLVKAMEEAEIPLGGANSPNLAPALMARFQPLIKLTMPAIKVQVKAVLAAATLLEATATIEEAFGPYSSGTFRLLAIRLTAVLSVAARLKLPNAGLLIPLPLPEEIELGKRVATSPYFKASFQGFVMPTLRIIPPISAYIAIKGTLGLNTKIPPLTFCTNCSA